MWKRKKKITGHEEMDVYDFSGLFLQKKMPL